MRKVLLLVGAVFLLYACKHKDAYTNKVEQYQVNLLSFYARPDLTPLDSLELSRFKGLAFFPIDPAYRCVAEIRWLLQLQFLQLPLTSGATEQYMKVAELHFKLRGKEFKLSAYQTDKLRLNRKLFIPFTDLTNAKTTYAGGRFIDVAYAPQATTAELDFNFAYAPGCAHAKKFICPLVPSDNHVPIEIIAGERQ